MICAMGGRLKPAAIALSLASVGIVLAAQGAGGGLWSFVAEPGLHVLYGLAFEYAYDGTTGNKLSELDWDIKPMVSVSSALRARVRSFEFGLSCTVGFPDYSGVMTDSDWDNESVGDTATKTNYSESDALAQGLVAVDLSLGRVFEPGPRLEMRTSLGFRWLDVSWSARGGWYQYASDYSPTNPPPYFSYTTGAVVPMHGLISTYEQRYFILFAGARADWLLSRSVALSAGVRASPAVWAVAIDNHVRRDFTATDWMSGGYLLEPQLGVAWSPAPPITLRLNAGYALIAGLHGDEVVVAGDNVDPTLHLAPGATRTYANSSGAGMSAVELELGAELKL